MSVKATVPVPTLEELRAAASQLHYKLNDKELAMYGEFMAGMVGDINLVDMLATPTLAVNIRAAN